MLGYLSVCTAILFPNPQLIPSEPAQVLLQSPAITSKPFSVGGIAEENKKASLNRSVVSQAMLEEQGPSCAKMSRWKEQMMSLENCDRIFSTTNDRLMFFGLVMQFNSL